MGPSSTSIQDSSYSLVVLATSDRDVKKILAGNLLGVCTGSTRNQKTGVVYKYCYGCQKTRKSTVLRPCERCNGEQYYDPAKFKMCWSCGGSKKRRR